MEALGTTCVAGWLCCGLDNGTDVGLLKEPNQAHRLGAVEHHSGERLSGGLSGVHAASYPAIEAGAQRGWGASAAVGAWSYAVGRIWLSWSRVL